MYIMLYKNPGDLEYNDFQIFNTKGEVWDFIDNIDYPMDYHVFHSIETFIFNKGENNERLVL